MARSCYYNLEQHPFNIELQKGLLQNWASARHQQNCGNLLQSEETYNYVSILKYTDRIFKT